MNLTAPGKLAALCLIVVGAFVSLMAGALDQTAAIAIIGPIAGYLVGNGSGALRGQDQQPVWTPSKHADDE